MYVTKVHISLNPKAMHNYVYEDNLARKLWPGALHIKRNVVMRVGKNLIGP